VTVEAAMQTGLGPKGEVQAIGQRLVDWLAPSVTPRKGS
jgi:hypothetical protein